MTGPQDDQLAERLRRATAEVPRSGLDLDDVLRQARVKARRARAVTGAAVVVALAAGGVGAGEVVPRLTAPPAAGDAAPPAAGPATPPAAGDAAMSATASSADEPRCPDGRALGVWFSDGAQSGPWVSQVLTMTVPADGASSGWTPAQPTQPTPTVTVTEGSAPEWYATVIRERAQRLGDARIPAAAFESEVHTLQIPVNGVPLTVVAAGGAPLVVEQPQPGAVYVAYAGGTRGMLTGMAGCGDERMPFEVHYTTVGETDALLCEPGTGGLTDLGLLTALAWCPAGHQPLEATQFATRAKARPQGDAVLKGDLNAVGLFPPPGH
ncbi:MAG: hypothetical protein FWF90_06630 [Promicromonosporaceae bacterium]|nr:hypothetical protein [Promicromonosporaceae bacterium]